MARTLFALLLLLVPAALAQSDTEEPVLEYRGTPIVVPVECSNEEIAEFGLVCPPERPCPVYLELTSVEFVGRKLFVSGNLHTESMTLFTVLLASDNGGLSWTEPAEPVVHAGLDEVAFYDNDHGWALGHVIDASGPRDPFFLLTTDGGRFWRKRPVFGESRRAEIVDFEFDSARSGIVLVDRLRTPESGGRYERYETMTGAEAWMIREVSSQPLRLRQRFQAAPDEWRVDTDADSGAWQVQRRQGDGWLTVAEFAVAAGACAAREEVLAEAPPEATEESADSSAEAAEAQQPEVAPGGVFVIGQPRTPPRSSQEVKRDTDDRPTIRRPNP
jgi:hypothetical protein